jgi:hypothetical protein
VVNGLVSLELDERVEAFDAAIKALGRQIKRWSAYSHYVVPDTSFYIEHPDKLEEVDFGPLINFWESNITLLVPMIVIDELVDALRRSRTATSAGAPATPSPSWTGCSPPQLTVLAFSGAP